MVGVPPLFNGEIIALPFAVGCGFAGGGLRELCPKEAIWHFSPFVFTRLHRRAVADDPALPGRLAGRAAARAGRSRAAPPGPRRCAGARTAGCSTWGRPREEPAGCGRFSWCCSRPSCASRRPSRSGTTPRIEHRLQEQEKLLLAAKIEALASQINPHFLFNTLASISSLIRTQPDTARMLIIEALRPAPPPDAEHGSFRHAARGAGIDRRVPRHRGHPLRTAAESRQADQRRHARRHRAEHDSAAAGRELDQARPGAQGRRRADYDQDDAARRPHRHRGARRWSRDERRAAGARASTAASDSATSTSGCARFTAPATS